MNRACRLSVAVMVASISSTYLIPKTYEARGYFGIGGEWLLILLIFWLAYMASKNMF